VQVPRVTYPTQVTQQQVPVVTYPVQQYAYAPMFLDILFLMLFLMLPLLMIIPLFKALTKAIS
jgi:hypothetical protein